MQEETELAGGGDRDGKGGFPIGQLATGVTKSRYRKVQEPKGRMLPLVSGGQTVSNSTQSPHSLCNCFLNAYHDQ